MLKTEWKLVVDIAREIQTNLDYVREKIKDSGEAVLPTDLAGPLARLEEYG